MLERDDAEWLADVFGLGPGARLVGPVDRGEQGQVWRLEVGPGRYAVKEALLPLEDDQAPLAHQFQSRAQSCGVRAPEAVLARDGRLTVRDRGAALRLFLWVEMAGADRTIDPAAVGRCLADLHRGGGPVDDRTHPWYHEPVGRRRWHELTDRLDQQGAPFAAQLAVLVDDLVDVESIMVEPSAPILCHRDLWADNVRASPAGGLMIIDWDNCGAASADQELGMVLLEFGGTEDRARRLCEAYCSAGGPGRVESLSDLTMPVAVVGHIGELACRQWLEATTEAARQRADARVAEFVGEPWTLAYLERVVGWTARR